MNKKYCFYCNEDVKTKIKSIEEEYTYRNKKFKVKENKEICLKCGNEVCPNNIDKELENTYNGYLQLYGLNLESFYNIRKSLNLSQELFSIGLGWSKKSIIRYENYEEIPSGEYLKLYMKLNNNKDYFLDCLYLNKNNIDEELFYKIIERINLKVDYKSRNTIMYILKDSKLFMVQILKYLFAIDFLSYKNHNKAITNFKYARLQYGPVVDNYKEIINMMIINNELKYGEPYYKNGDIKMTYEIKKEPDLKIFNSEEIKIMNQIKAKFKNKSAQALSDWSHNFKGWQETKTGQIIDMDKYAKYFELNI